MKNRIVLAYSGGLDTSVAIPYLARQTEGEVVAVALDLGQGGEDMESVRQRALDCGASSPLSLMPATNLPKNIACRRCRLTACI